MANYHTDRKIFDKFESIIYRSHGDSNIFHAYNLIFFLSTVQLTNILTLTAGKTNTVENGLCHTNYKVWHSVCDQMCFTAWKFKCTSGERDLQHVQRWLACHQQEWPQTGGKCLSVWRTPSRQGCWWSGPWSPQKPEPGGGGEWRGRSCPHWIHAGDPLCHGVCSSFWQSLAMLLSKIPVINEQSC